MDNKISTTLFGRRSNESARYGHIVKRMDKHSHVDDDTKAIGILIISWEESN